eukprot:scaffold22636_cov28-Tisochrysis_lutea.AAC.3
MRSESGASILPGTLVPVDREASTPVASCGGSKAAPSGSLVPIGAPDPEECTSRVALLSNKRRERCTEGVPPSEAHLARALRLQLRVSTGSGRSGCRAQHVLRVGAERRLAARADGENNVSLHLAVCAKTRGGGPAFGRARVRCSGEKSGLRPDRAERVDFRAHLRLLELVVYRLGAGL